VVYLKLTCLGDAESVKERMCSGAPETFKREMEKTEESFPFNFCIANCSPFHRKIEIVKREEARQFGQTTLAAGER